MLLASTIRVCFRGVGNLHVFFLIMMLVGAVLEEVPESCRNNPEAVLSPIGTLRFSICVFQSPPFRVVCIN